ncbi:hypothetical protein Dimus_034772 [Dionaea muscipula]
MARERRSNDGSSRGFRAAGFGDQRGTFSVVAQRIKSVRGIAIRRTNRLWIKDKELKVKLVDFHKKMGAARVAGGFGGGKPFPTKASYANVVKKGTIRAESVPTIGVETIGNGWLYRSAKASWFKRLNHWSTTVECSLGRNFGRLVTAYRFMHGMLAPFVASAIAGERLYEIEEDTAKCARVDMGKVKIFTHQMATINRVMRLMVGTIPFDIRVVEERAVFIRNSDFRCGCLCHVQEEEEHFSADENEEGDDVAGMEVDRPREDDCIECSICRCQVAE